jgi:hypothetical protein
MLDRIKSFENFIGEHWSAFAPGSVVVPGEWYKDNVNSRNYRPAYTQMPQVVDDLYNTTDLYSYLDELAEEEEFQKMLTKEHKDSKKVLKYVKQRIHETLSGKAKTESK